MQTQAGSKTFNWMGTGVLFLVTGIVVILFLVVGVAGSFAYRRYYHTYCGQRSKPIVYSQRSHKTCQDRMLKLGDATERKDLIERPRNFSDEDCRCPITLIAYESFFVDDSHFVIYCPGHHWQNQFVYYTSSDSKLHHDAPESGWSEQLVSGYLWKTVEPDRALQLALKSSANATDFPSLPLFLTAQLATELGKNDVLEANLLKLQEVTQIPILGCQRVASLAILGKRDQAFKLAKSLTNKPDIGELAKVLLADLYLEEGKYDEAERLYRQSSWDNSGEAWEALIRKDIERAHSLSCQQLDKRKFSTSQSYEWLRIAILTGRKLGGRAEVVSKDWMAKALQEAPRDENYFALQYFNQEITAEHYLNLLKTPGRLNVGRFNVGAWLVAENNPGAAQKYLQGVVLPFTYERLVVKGL